MKCPYCQKEIELKNKTLLVKPKDNPAPKEKTKKKAKKSGG